MPTIIIRGNDALHSYTGTYRNFILKAIAFYGFPKPTKANDGHRPYNIWDKAEVDNWFKTDNALRLERQTKVSLYGNRW